MQIMNLTLNRSFLWSALSIGLMALVFFATVPSLVSAMFTRGPDDLQVASSLQGHIDNHGRQLEIYLARFDGRSIFYRPRPTPKRTVAPPLPPRPEPKAQTREDKPPRPAPPPPTYTGPSIMAIFGDEVWFVNPQHDQPPLRIKVGEEQLGLEVLSTDPPWMVNVRYRKGEYDVNLFELKSFFTDTSDTEIPNPPGLIDAPAETPATGEEPPAETVPDESDKSEKNNGSDDTTPSKSDPTDADNTDTSNVKTGNQAPPDENGAARQSRNAAAGHDTIGV